MYNLIPVLATIDPTEVEGLLSKFGLHPTVLAIILYTIAVINVLIPIVGPYVYKLFGAKIEKLKEQLNVFKDEVNTGFNNVDAVITRIDDSLAKIAQNGEVNQTILSETKVVTDLLIEVLKYSRVSDEVKQKVELVRASREARDLEFSRKVEEQTIIIDGLRKDLLALKEKQSKLVERQIQALKKNKKR